MKTIDDIIAEDNKNISQHCEDLMKKAEKARKEILFGEFDLLLDHQEENQRIRYINQFLSNVTACALFPDEDLLSKLREYGFSKPVIRWFTPLSEIKYELNRLRTFNGAVFILNSYLTAIVFYLEKKMFIEIIESFDLMNKHGKNEESNILHKNIDNLFRRRKYNNEKGQIGKMNYAEQIINNLIDSINQKVKPECDLEEFMLDSTQGKYNELKQCFLAYDAPEMSKNQVYLILFPIIKLTFKDKEMLSEVEFDNLPELIYGGSYRKYQISRVKKILSLK